MRDRFHKNIRIQNWDYSQAAVYMVTICVADRTHRFGQPSSAGRMITQEIVALPEHHSQVELAQFVVMPNHSHLIVGINLALEEFKPITLPNLIGELKSRTTNRYTNGVKMGLLPSFDKGLWQEGHYETIMRDERMAEERRGYIINNPTNWRDDAVTCPLVGHIIVKLSDCTTPVDHHMAAFMR